MIEVQCEISKVCVVTISCHYPVPTNQRLTTKHCLWLVLVFVHSLCTRNLFLIVQQCECSLTTSHLHNFNTCVNYL